jgi:hypothetical protein
MESSWSWRLTYPLRLADETVKGWKATLHPHCRFAKDVTLKAST